LGQISLIAEELLPRGKKQSIPEAGCRYSGFGTGRTVWVSDSVVFISIAVSFGIITSVVVACE